VKGCALLAAAAICGCGRLGFDPPGSSDGAAGDDAPPGGSDASGSGGIDAMTDAMMIDAMPAACAEAIEVFANTMKRSATCLGLDRFDGCGPNATEEVVFKWVVPASGSYTVTSTNVGTGAINSTGRVNAGCTGTTSCIGVSQTMYTAGQVIYFALEAPTGGCVTYDFLIMSN
jgi:hypothetical protein